MRNHIACTVLCLLSLSLSAAVKLPSIFSDHAVLARRASVPVWGKAAPGEKVVVMLGKKRASAVAGKDGSWCVELNLADSPEGPFELRVNELRIRDVVVGEVWLCSGQSNMLFRLEQTLHAKEECRRTDTGLRTFNVSSTAAAQPQPDCEGKWSVCNPADSGKFSAVAYFFGKKLRRELKRPVGLIHASYGGTSITAWVPEEVTEKFPEAKRQKREQLKIYREYPGKLRCAVSGLAAWEEKYNRGDTPAHKLPGAGSVWSPVPLVHAYSGAPGAVWFRNEIELTELPGNPGIAWRRQRNPITCYINGVKIASHPVERALMRESFSPKIPAGVLKTGKNEILYRVFCSYKAPSIDGGIVVAGVMPDPQRWTVCVERKLPEITPAMRKALPEIPDYAAPEARRIGNYLFNGMIAPLCPAALSGILWYQGENDLNIRPLYSRMMPEMIAAWRKSFRDPELPFFYCQLPAYRAKQSDPGACSNWTAMRETQDSALTVPHTGGAVLVDAGEAYDIHYLDKTLPGTRLAALALGQVYGKKGEYRSPRMRSCRLENGKIHIRFDFTGSGLEARPLPEKYPLTILRKMYSPSVPNLPGSPLQGFAVCTKDGKWLWAKAEIINGEVVVTPPEVPVKVRYAWQDNPTCNLYNKEGFPAAPFQTAVKGSVQ